MTRPVGLEDAIEKALAAARQKDYDETLRFLSFALTRAANERSALPGRGTRVPLLGPLGDPERGEGGAAGTRPRERPREP